MQNIIEKIFVSVPNLDEMSSYDLMLFWQKSQTNSNFANELFPSRKKGHHVIAQALASYASIKSSAKMARNKGNVVLAEQYENLCNKIYSDLPIWARWKK